MFPGVTPWEAGKNDIRAAYAAAAREFDPTLDELLEHWDAAVGLEGSLVVFYSDHGEHLFDPGAPTVEEALAGDVDNPSASDEYALLGHPILNHGNSMQESLLRVPLLVSYPSSYGLSGRVVDAPASLVDVLPTVLDVAGIDPVPASDSLPGRSLLEIARRAPSREPLIIADYQFYGAPLASVRRGAYKLVFDPDGQDWELRETCLACRPDGDPGTVVDDPDVLAELMGGLRAYLRGASTAAPELESTREVALEEVVRELESLGYVR
jgi:arylsulfatase A-like enzyme